MYAGIAAGSNKAHSKNHLPQNEYLAIIHEVEIPKIKERDPTPNIKINVFKKYFNRTVWIKCSKISEVLVIAVKTIKKIGDYKNKHINMKIIL